MTISKEIKFILALFYKAYQPGKRIPIKRIYTYEYSFSFCNLPYPVLLPSRHLRCRDTSLPEGGFDTGGRLRYRREACSAFYAERYPPDSFRKNVIKLAERDIDFLFDIFYNKAKRLHFLLPVKIVDFTTQKGIRLPCLILAFFGSACYNRIIKTAKRKKCYETGCFW